MTKPSRGSIIRARGDTDSDDDAISDDPVTYASNIRKAGKLFVRIPNLEIRGKFHQWLRDHIFRMMTPETQTKSTNMFRAMVSGDLSSFATQFGRFVLETVPSEFLGSKENVYQAYVSAYLTSAGEESVASEHGPPEDHTAWDIKVEYPGGAGRMDLILQRTGDETGVIQEFKRIRFLKRDREAGYGDSQRNRLTTKAEEALRQLETRHYRAAMKDHVKKVHEYGVAFLGPFCAIVGRSLERKQDGGWVITNTYDAVRDEERRTSLYNLQTN